MEQLQLNPEELASLQTFIDRADAAKQGFNAGIEQAKLLFIQAIKDQRTPGDSE